MANTVGTITIEMAANLAALVSDLGKAQQESAKAFREIQRQGQESFNAIKDSFKELVAAIGVGLSVEGLKEFAKSAFDAAERTENLSQSLGLTTQSLQVMGYAAGLTGSSMDVVGGAMAKLEKSAVLAASGNKQLQGIFAALGVSVTDTAGKIKPADQLIVEVSKHLSGFANDSEKTTAAMLLMGRGAAQNIPLLNELGTHFEELKARAKELGIVLSDTDQKALAETKRSFNELGQEMDGLSNQFALALKPAIDEVVTAFGRLLQSSELKSGFNDIGTAAKFLVDHMQGLYEIAKVLVEIQLADWLVKVAAGLGSMAISAATTEVKVLSLKGAITSLNVAILGFNAGTYLRENFSSVAVASDKLVGSLMLVGNQTRGIAKEVGAFFTSMATNPTQKEWEATLARIRGETDSNSKSILEYARDLVSYELGLGKATTATVHHSAVLKDFNVTTDEAAKKHLNLGDALGKESNVSEEAAKALAALEATVNALSGKTGPAAKAWADYVAQITKLDTEYATAIKVAGNVAIAQGLLKKGVDEATAAYQHNKEIIDSLNLLKQDEGTALDQLLVKYKEEEDSLTQSAGEHERVSAELAAEKQMREVLAQTIKDGHPLSQQEIDDAIAAAKAHADYTLELKKEQAVQKEWQSITVSGFDSVGKSIADFATGGIKTWKDFGKSLLGDAKQFIAAIIQEFLKLTVFNGIINRLFNLSGTAGELPTMAGGGGGFGSLISLVTGNGGSGGGSSISAGSIFSPDTWISAGKNVYNGFTSMFGGGGAPASAGQLGDFTGPGTQYLNYGGEYNITGDAAAGVDQSFNAAADFGGGAGGPGFWGSGMGSYGGVMGIAGGVLAGYNEFNAAGGGVGGVLGGAAYGIGTAAVSGAVGTAMAGGLSAGLAAIPVVGWIALAAMVINMVSGGKLFGTAWSTKTAGVDLNIGPDGGTAHTWEYQQKQGMFFSGMQKRTKDVASSPEAIKAAQDFFDSIKKVMTDSATALKIDVPPIIEASLDTINEYDKKGHVKSTKYIVEAFGQQWTEATAELAAKRIQADAILDVISHTTVGADAIAIAGQFQASADTLLDAAGTMLQATADIQSGKGLLGLNATLGDTMSEVVKLQAGGESLVQTYGRLQQEVQTMHQTFDLMGIDLGIVGKDFVELTDDMVKSAGSLQNLQTLWDDYFKNYYTGQEQQAANLKHLAQTANDDLIGIGMSASTTMAQFRSAFEAEQAKDAAAVAAGTMTAQEAADDLVKWLQAGEALAQFTAAVVQVGQAASQAVQQSTQAFQQLVQNTQSIAAQLFGTGADQIQAKIDQLMKFGNDTGMYDFRQITALKKQLADQQEAQRAASQLQLATGLIGDFGAIGAQTGETMQQIAEQFHVPLDKLESIFHTDQAGLEKQYEQAVAAAQASITTALNTTFTNELLADILAQQQGLAMPFSQADLNAAMNMQTASAAAPGNKPGAGGFGLPGAHTASIVSIAPAQATRASDIFITPTGASTTTSTAGGTTAGENALLDAVDRNTAETRALGQHINNLHGVMERNGFGAGTMGWQEGGNGLRRMALAR